jgi:hypothetical protein
MFCLVFFYYANGGFPSGAAYVFCFSASCPLQVMDAWMRGTRLSLLPGPPARAVVVLRRSAAFRAAFDKGGRGGGDEGPSGGPSGAAAAFEAAAQQEAVRLAAEVSGAKGGAAAGSGERRAGSPTKTRKDGDGESDGEDECEEGPKLAVVLTLGAAVKGGGKRVEILCAEEERFLLEVRICRFLCARGFPGGDGIIIIYFFVIRVLR